MQQYVCIVYTRAAVRPRSRNWLVETSYMSRYIFLDPFYILSNIESIYVYIYIYIFRLYDIPCISVARSRSNYEERAYIK